MPQNLPLGKVDPAWKLRRVPVSRLMARLGVSQYNKTARLHEEIEVAPKIVKIMLSQHIGAPAAAVVKKGDTVSVGQPIAVAAEGKLGVNIHASINGTVREVTGTFILIER